MSQEEFDINLFDLKEILNLIMYLLQEMEEDQRHGWVLRMKNVKWPILQERLKCNLISSLEKRELKKIEYEGEDLYLDEPKQGPLHSEEDDGDEEMRLMKNLMDCVKTPKQQLGSSINCSQFCL